MQDFEVRIETRIPGTPEQTWAAFTERCDAFLWPVTYEPWVGGGERGLSSGGGVVTAWEPARHFGTRAEKPNGWWNQLDYWLDQLADGTTWLTYHHRTVAVVDDRDNELDGCRAHTDLYLHSLAEYVRHFAAKTPQYVSVDAPGGSARGIAALGLTRVDDPLPAHTEPRAPGDPLFAVGDRVTIGGPSGTIDGVIDYAAPTFLGVRTADAFLRVYGREPWGHPSDVAVHLFDPAADADAWRAHLEGALAGAVA